MGKHLAPKPKHELNFIKNRASRASGQTRSAQRPRVKREAASPRASREAPPRRPVRETPTAQKRMRVPRLSMLRVKIPQSLPPMGRFSWLFPLLAALMLVGLSFVPLEGWMIPAAFAVPALLAMMEHAADAYENLRAGHYLNNALFVYDSAEKEIVAIFADVNGDIGFAAES